MLYKEVHREKFFFRINAYVESDDFEDYFSGYMAALIEHIATPENLSVILEAEPDEVEELLSYEDMTMDDFAQEFSEGVEEGIEEAFSIENMDFDSFSGEGNYEIKLNTIYLDGSEERNMTYTGSKIEAIYKGEEGELDITFEKQ